MLIGICITLRRRHIIRDYLALSKLNFPEKSTSNSFCWEDNYNHTYIQITQIIFKTNKNERLNNSIFNNNLNINISSKIYKLNIILRVPTQTFLLTKYLSY